MNANVPGKNAGRSRFRAVRALQSHHPHVSNDGASGVAPAMLTRPCVGRKPQTPWYEAGMRTEPAVSLPIAKSTSPAATTDCKAASKRYWRMAHSLTQNEKRRAGRSLLNITTRAADAWQGCMNAILHTQPTLGRYSCGPVWSRRSMPPNWI